MCRTAALGWHVDECTHCGYSGHSYNSCRNRHCPKCQANARLRWIHGRRKNFFPSPMPTSFSRCLVSWLTLALQNKKLIYTLLMRLSAETLIEVARNPKYLGAEIGFFSVLHTWTQKLEHHPHVHCVVPAGGLSFDRQRWVSCESALSLLPAAKGTAAIVFRAKLTRGSRGRLSPGSKIRFHGQVQHLSDPKTFHAFVRQLFRHEWVVHCKRPFGGPEYVLRYLGRYTHRVAISNHRLVSFDQRRGHLPLEGPCAWQPGTTHDTHDR